MNGDNEGKEEKIRIPSFRRQPRANRFSDRIRIEPANAGVGLPYWSSAETPTTPAAPVTVGEKVGMLKITAPDFPDMNIPVYAAETVSRAGFFSRILLGLRSFISGHH